MSAPSPETEPQQSLPEPPSTPGRTPWWRALQATATRRALLLTALGALLIAGLTTALGVEGGKPDQLVSYLGGDPVPSTGARGNESFNTARSGDCLTWPDNQPDRASIVDCSAEHRFEVAESVDMRTFPGSEYGPDAAPPSAARIQQISQEQCQVAVERYLGPDFDPNSRFSISMLWSGDKAWTQAGERRVLCGLQLQGTGNLPMLFAGRIADIDQSKVWPPGTCLGIDPSTNQPTDVPVDCAAPHAMEVTGIVDVGARFPGPLPSEADQDTFIKDTCTRTTDAYLAPVQLRSTTLTLIYSTVSLPSWTAASRQVACSVGATLGNGGWATLVGPARGPLLINGRPPVPPPDIPDERLDLSPVPLPVPIEPDTDVAVQATQQPTSTTPTAPGPTTSTPQSNTFITEAPPPPGPAPGPPSPVAPLPADPPPGDPLAPAPFLPPAFPPPGAVPGPPVPAPVPA